MNSDNRTRSITQRGTWLLIAVVLTFGVTTITGFGGRLGWLLELTSHFRVQYFWLLLSAAVGLALLGRARWAWTAAALAALNLVLILPLYFGPAQQVSSGSISRAISINVNWRNRDFEPTLELIRKEQPDFVLLIEITPEWAQVLKVLDSEYPYRHVDPRADHGGIALYSRVPIKDVSIHDMVGSNLQPIVVELELASGRLCLIGAHPGSPSTPLEFHLRNRQLAGLARLAKQQPGAVMLLGDLNTSSWSPFFSDLLSDAGLVDTRRGFGVLGSWPGAWMPFRIPIDHCLVSPEITVVDRRIGGDMNSDHRPVIVDFAIRSK